MSVDYPSVLGNRACMGAVVVNAPQVPTDAGPVFTIQVEEYGSGSSGLPDRIRILNSVDECWDPAAPWHEVVHGNLAIR